MKKLFITAMVGGLALASPALAQSAAPAKPCERGQTHFTMAGIDTDVTRCEMALMTNQLGALQGQLVEVQAALLLSRSDLAAVQDESAKNAQYWAAYIEGIKSNAKP